MKDDITDRVKAAVATDEALVEGRIIDQIRWGTLLLFVLLLMIGALYYEGETKCWNRESGGEEIFLCGYMTIEYRIDEIADDSLPVVIDHNYHTKNAHNSLADILRGSTWPQSQADLPNPKGCH